MGPTGETPVVPERIGIALGTAYGCLDSMYANTQRVQTRGARMASPLLFMHSFVNAPASLIAIEWGLQGPGATFTDGGLSAASALYWACDLLRRGEVDMMLVGGVEALGDALQRSVVGGRWSVEGRGEVEGWEAAAMFLLERAEVAEARGARVLAEVGEVTAPTPSEAKAGSDGRDAHRTRDAGLEVRATDCPLTLGRGLGGRACAFGAQFALLLAQALGGLARQPSGSRLTIEEAEGIRTAKTILIKP